jgi:hypothetical protein
MVSWNLLIHGYAAQQNGENDHSGRRHGGVRGSHERRSNERCPAPSPWSRISAGGVTPGVVSLELSTNKNKTEEAVVTTTGVRIVQPGRSGY